MCCWYLFLFSVHSFCFILSMVRLLCRCFQAIIFRASSLHCSNWSGVYGQQLILYLHLLASNRYTFRRIVASFISLRSHSFTLFLSLWLAAWLRNNLLEISIRNMFRWQKFNQKNIGSHFSVRIETQFSGQMWSFKLIPIRNELLVCFECDSECGFECGF